MKYIFTFLLAGLSFMAVSAQSRDNDDYRSSQNQWQGQSYDSYHRDNFRADNNFEQRIAEINRVYQHRIWEVKSDYSLSFWQKRKMIQELNYERESKISGIQNWAQRKNWETRRNYNTERDYHNNNF